MTTEPLVSVICFCRDRAATIRRCVESVLNQSYRNFELVIQDGASTDGTVEIIRSYNDPRIKLVSEPDSGPEEAFWKTLRRCEGAIIASCLSDEELLPHALEEAVGIFARKPRVGAITRDGYLTNSKGKVTGEFIAGEFDFVDYLFGRYCPMWVASFFRRQALLDVGLADDDWTIGCLEFEIWCRLGTQHTVEYVPGIVAKYGIDEQQLSNTPKNFNKHLDSRIKVIDRLFSEDGFFGDDKVKKYGCLYNQLFLYYNHARAYKLNDQVEQIYYRLMELVESFPDASQAERKAFFSQTESEFNERHMVQDRAWHVWAECSSRLPRSVKDLLSPERRAAIRKLALRVFYAYFTFIGPPRLYFKERAKTNAKWDAIFGLTAPSYSKRVYHDVASLYYGRGQIDYAEVLWRKAEALGDKVIDSIAVQATLLSPTATHESLLEGQRRWAARHANPLPDLPPMKVTPYRGDRKIRIGYHCSFYDGDVVRAMFAPVARCHDRQRFTPIAYSISSAPPDLESSFDEFRVTRYIPDREFIERVRNDRIDIFVEMSGFSPHHRFSAMGSRCAPIQIAHFNHSGTCGVPNVDYVFADAISVLPEDEKHYTETVWRLDEDFLFFNYEWANLPEPCEPPCLKNGYVTFGCFGSGGKVNDDTIELWAGALRRVPGSRIYIRNSYLKHKANRDYMCRRFARHGVDASRLRLAGAEEWRNFIKSYEQVDISLDTFPYCGANTVGESVWQGVPVVTLKGNRFSSRYGSSHVTYAGTPELVADTPERFVEIAADLAGNTERLKHLRTNLRRMAKEFGLSDPVRFARKLEKGYLAMMARLDGRTG